MISFDLLAKAVELEERWDRRLGGFESRPYRDLFGYVCGRLLANGTEPEDLVGYLEELISVWKPHLPATGAEGSS